MKWILITLILVITLMPACADSEYKWTVMYTNNREPTGIWGSSPDDVFAVNGWGDILHYDGNSWSEVYSGNSIYGLENIWGSSDSDIFAVGRYGTMLHYNGTSWSNISSELEGILSNEHYTILYDVWGSSASDIFVVGCELDTPYDDSVIFHYDGISWRLMRYTADEGLYRIWGSSPDDVFAFTSQGDILHYDGNSWSEMHTSHSYTIWGAWGSSSNDVFAVGPGGLIIHYDGSEWSEIELEGYYGHLRGVWGYSSTDSTKVFITGEYGSVWYLNGTYLTKIRGDTDDYFRDLWCSSTSEYDDVFVVGRDAGYWPDGPFNGIILHYGWEE